MPPPRGKTRVEWRSGAPAARLRTRRELFAAQKTSRRIAGPGKGWWCEVGKEYETEQLKLGTVPTRYNIRQKFVNASRDSGPPLNLLSASPSRGGLSTTAAVHLLYVHAVHRVMVFPFVRSFVRCSIRRCYTRSISARSNFVTEISSTFLRTEIYRPTFPSARNAPSGEDLSEDYANFEIDSAPVATAC